MPGATKVYDLANCNEKWLQRIISPCKILKIKFIPLFATNNELSYQSSEHPNVTFNKELTTPILVTLSRQFLRSVHRYLFSVNLFYFYSSVSRQPDIVQQQPAIKGSLILYLDNVLSEGGGDGFEYLYFSIFVGSNAISSR